jgi:hypothetical protein
LIPNTRILERIPKVAKIIKSMVYRRDFFKLYIYIV